MFLYILFAALHTYHTNNNNDNTYDNDNDTNNDHTYKSLPGGGGV